MPVTAPARKLVCLTPVRNEAWILERFLRCAETWADLIVVLDQASDDGSTEIARRHPKVHLVEYSRTTFDEDIRRKMLVEIGRSLVPEPRVLVSLDADEAIAADAWEQPEMRVLLASQPGTVGRMRWINVLPDDPRAWIPPALTDFMFVDDGREFRGEAIHGPRLPRAAASETLDLDGPKVIHLQYVDTERMRSKQRWYQAHERIESPRKRPIQIYRQYHQMDAIDPAERHRLDESWFRPYVVDRGIDLFDAAPQGAYSTDDRVLDLFAQHGPECFRRIDLWDGRWQERAHALGRPAPPGLLNDPHSLSERAVFRWLERTQARSLEPRVRWVQRGLRLAGW